MPNNDRNILDVITAVNTDLRHTAEFRALLHPLDADAERRVAKLYVEFLYRTLDICGWPVSGTGRAAGAPAALTKTH